MTEQSMGLRGTSNFSVSLALIGLGEVLPMHGLTILMIKSSGKLADLESREVLLAKLAGAMKASLTKAAYVFNALPSKAVRTVDALREKQESAA